MAHESIKRIFRPSSSGYMIMTEIHKKNSKGEKKYSGVKK